MRKLRILVLMHEDCVPPESLSGFTDKEIAAWKTEYDVLAGLEELGHEAIPLGVATELGAVRAALHEYRPHIVFNLLEEFHGLEIHVPHVLGYLELLRIPYTGCNPRALVLTHSKALTKKILRYHRIRVPDFAVFPRNRRARRPARLSFPLIVKSTTVHGSVGISQSSVVHDDEKLYERVSFIHDQLGTDAIAERYIHGRELYVGVLGNRRLQTFPVWEMLFRNVAEGAPRIATAKAKRDPTYQKRAGIITHAACDIPPETAARISRTCKRVYHVLEQSGYARMDLRLTPEGEVYLIEPNPNPELAYGEDFAESAETVGVSYVQLLHRIVNLGLRYQLHSG